MAKLDVKEAVRMAREYVCDLYLQEEVMDIGLEEVVFDDTSNVWKITMGFSRPWDRRFTPTGAFRDAGKGRSYKVLRINDENGCVESLMDRLMTDQT